MICEELVFAQPCYFHDNGRSGAIVKLEDSVSICYGLDRNNWCGDGDEADRVVEVEIEALS